MASACGVNFNLVVSGERFFGREKVPASKRLVSTQIPVSSQQMILIRVWRRLLKTNKAPCFWSSPNRSVTRACSPLKLCACRRLHRHEHLQAPRKTQHGLASARNNSAARAACLTPPISTLAPPGNSKTSASGFFCHRKVGRPPPPPPVSAPTAHIVASWSGGNVATSRSGSNTSDPPAGRTEWRTPRCVQAPSR
jgi:hypothetical protein